MGKKQTPKMKNQTPNKEVLSESSEFSTHQRRKNQVPAADQPGGAHPKIPLRPHLPGSLPEATQEKHNFPRKRTVPTSRGDAKPGASGTSEAVPGKSERQPCSVPGRKPGLHQASRDRGQLQGRVTKARSRNFSKRCPQHHLLLRQCVEALPIKPLFPLYKAEKGCAPICHPEQAPRICHPEQAPRKCYEGAGRGDRPPRSTDGRGGGPGRLTGCRTQAGTEKRQLSPSDANHRAWAPVGGPEEGVSVTRDPGHRRATTSPATQKGGSPLPRQAHPGGTRHDQGRARLGPEVGAPGAEVAVLSWSQAVPGGAGVQGGGRTTTTSRRAERFP